MKMDLRDYSKTMGAEEASDPLEMLKTISPLLNVKGGINSAEDATKIVSLMRNSKKLVAKCIYLNILKVTCDNEIFERFIAEGGWKIMNKWLSEAKDSENLAIILEILKLLQQLPLRIQHLKENNTPKIVKHYAKSSDSKLKSAASSLMNSWMAIIRGSSAPENEPAKKKKDKDKKKSKLDKVSPSQTKPKTNEKEKQNSMPVLKAPSFAKFRKTGLETDQPPKKKMKSKPALATGKRSSIDNDSAPAVPEKKIKPADLKPKKITISEGFMDALNSASNPVPIVPKKIKRKPLKPSPTATNATSKPNQNMEYATGDANDFSASELLKKLSPKRESPVPPEPVKPKLNKYGKPTKSVRWLCDEKLESVRYFEVDENERVNVSTQSFKDAQHREMMIERQMLKGKMHHEEGGQDGGSWRKPSPLDSAEQLVVPGCNSIEKDIQTEREKTVLMEIFLTRDMVPDSPAEPDPEPYEIMQPKIIPFDDENSILESMEPEAMDQENGSTDNNLVKNMLDGMQNQNQDGDLTEKLKQILQTATAMTNNGQPPNGQQANQFPPQMPNGPMMMGPPQGNPQMMPMQNMNMNGQNGPPPQMGFYGGQMMPVQDPNFFNQQNWGPPNGPPPNHMGPPPQMNGPNFNQNWNRPKWGPRDGPPPRPDFRNRNQWRGRWDNNRRRR